MLTVETPAELKKHVGQKLGTSDWMEITQPMINAFADATGDHNWIHVDVERAQKEMPGGKTIAHGYLTLSLIPMLSRSVYRITHRAKGFNYGSNKVRFTAPVPCGSRVRLIETLKDYAEVDTGTRLTFECVVEVEGGGKPAMVAETLVLIAKD